MSEGGYKIQNQAAIHFITFAVVEWVDVYKKRIPGYSVGEYKVLPG
jgi:hypothetical protein